MSSVSLKRVGAVALVAVCLWSAAAIAVSFPWSTDPLADESATGPHAEYYRGVYSADPPSSVTTTESVPLSDREQVYVDRARAEAARAGVVDHVSRFVRRYGLTAGRVLDVGAGSGLLQDVVADYTGLDVSPTAKRYFHKPFIEASATEMPFPPDAFDAAWSIWVLEHIPNPEKALMEMRRVVRAGGYIFLWPAYEVDRYAAQGYRVRSASAFTWRGRLFRETIPLADSRILRYLYAPQIRALRLMAAGLGRVPSRFRFIRLTPNYDEYWVPDSDATTSFTRFELHLWFASRGDLVLECPPLTQTVFREYRTEPLIVQVRK
jgi:SAM-dependent methyltransferase